MSGNQRGELSNFSVFGPAQLQAELFSDLRVEISSPAATADRRFDYLDV
jgi:hypothetical protein